MKFLLAFLKCMKSFVLLFYICINSLKSLKLLPAHDIQILFVFRMFHLIFDSESTGINNHPIISRNKLGLKDSPAIRTIIFLHEKDIIRWPFLPPHDPRCHWCQERMERIFFFDDRTVMVTKAFSDAWFTFSRLELRKREKFAVLLEIIPFKLFLNISFLSATIF